MTPEQESEAIIVRAEAELRSLCEGPRRWTMSVPAREHEDSDLVFASLIRLAREQAAHVTEVRALLTEFVESDGVANYDSSLCWGCDEPDTGPHAPDCLVARALAALADG